jgi:alpha-glucosidase
VRRIIRQTMLEVNPDTILLGESTNDATSDFQGDAWHGAMTYANFTRPLWSWLSEPGSPARGGLNMPLGIIPGFGVEQFYEAHRKFSAGFPWRVRLHNMNALDTHDTPRFLTHALPGTVPVALGLSLTLPGIPVIFAGDEFGLIGDDGEHSRSPIPWQLLEDTADPAYAAHARDTLSLYTALVQFRRAHPALNGGGIRWVHAGDDLLAFVRESADESVLVVAARSPYDVTLSATAIAGDPVPLFGPGQAENFGSGIRIAGDGPSFSAWSLPGIEIPDFG